MDSRSGGDPRPWQTLSSSYVERRRWFTLRRDEVRLTNGRILEDYYVWEFPDWVNVVAVTDDDQIVLVRQYRHGLRQVDFELPAGVCESDDSDPEETAQRELLEETGFGGGRWTPWMTLSANPANHTNRNYSYLAEGVDRLQPQTLDDSEEIHVHLVPLNRAREIVLSGQIVQALHAAPLLKYLMTRLNV